MNILLAHGDRIQGRDYLIIEGKSIDMDITETGQIKELQCEDCKGTGEIERNIQRDGYPEMDVPTVCSQCNGTGKTKINS